MFFAALCGTVLECPQSSYFFLGNSLSQTRIHLPVVPPRDDRSSPELHVAVCDSVEFGHQAAVFTPRQVTFLILIPALTIHMTIIWVNA